MPRSNPAQNKVVVKAPPPALLEHLYLEWQLTPELIARWLDVHPYTLRRWLKRMEANPHVKPVRAFTGLPTPPAPSRRELARLHFEEGREVDAIARYCAVRIEVAIEWLLDAGLLPRFPVIAEGEYHHDMPPRSELYELYIDGTSFDDLGQRYKRSPLTVAQWLYAQGITDDQPDPEHHLPSFELLFALYWEQRLSLQEIGALFGSEPEDAGRWLDQRDIPRRQSRPHDDYLRGLFVDECFSTDEIAECFDVAPEIAHRWLIEARLLSAQAPLRSARATRARTSL